MTGIMKSLALLLVFAGVGLVHSQTAYPPASPFYDPRAYYDPRYYDPRLYGRDRLLVRPQPLPPIRGPIPPAPPSVGPIAPALAPPVDETPKPYQFQYVADAIGGQSSRTEAADGTGRVVGSYTLTDEDGRARTVEYEADELGFRANVQTNELGTKSESPASTVFYSTAPDPHLVQFPEPPRVDRPRLAAAPVAAPASGLAPVVPEAVPQGLRAPGAYLGRPLPGIPPYGGAYDPRYYRGGYTNPYLYGAQPYYK